MTPGTIVLLLTGGSGDASHLTIDFEGLDGKRVLFARQLPIALGGEHCPSV
jgi:hypothetical protein